MSVYAWVRQGEGGADPVIVINNFTPTPCDAYRLGVPNEGVWDVVLNSNAETYGQSGHGAKAFSREAIPDSGQQHSISLDLPENTALFLKRFGG